MISKRVSDVISPKMKKTEYGYLHSNACPQSRLKLERCKPHKIARHQMKCDLIINDIKLIRQYMAGYTVANF